MPQEKMDVKKSILSFAFIAFALLGVLFGMNIMTYIFGSLGSAQSTTFTDTSVTIINETGGYINRTGYVVNASTIAAPAASPWTDTGYTANFACGHRDRATLIKSWTAAPWGDVMRVTCSG